MRDALTRLFMTADTVGGVWTYALDLARGLAAHGVRTTLATLGPAASAAQRGQAATVPDLQLIDSEAPLDWLAVDPAAVAGAAARVAGLARLHGAQIVHLNAPALAGLAHSSASGFDMPVLGACHSCVASWWDAVRDGPLPADLQWRTELLARGYRACDKLVAPSAAFATVTARLYGRRPAVVHNGAEAVPGIRTRTRCVLTAGRLWDAGKNLAALNRAAARIDAPVLAAGPLLGPTGDAVVADRIACLGALDHAAVQDRMRSAAVFASLAVYEPFGLAVLEAAGAGCALVLSDSAGFRELWDGAAVFVPAHDDQAAAAALQSLLDDDGHCAELAAAAQARAGHYTIARMADATLDLYRGLQAGTEAAA